MPMCTLYISMWLHVGLRASVGLCACIHVCTLCLHDVPYTCVCIPLYFHCVSVHLYACLFVSVCIPLYLCACMHACVCMCTYIYNCVPETCVCTRVLVCVFMSAFVWVHIKSRDMHVCVCSSQGETLPESACAVGRLLDQGSRLKSPQSKDTFSLPSTLGDLEWEKGPRER